MSSHAHKSILKKRLLSGLLDLLIIDFIDKILFLLFGYKGFLPYLYFPLALTMLKTTLGGVVFGLQTISADNKPFGFIRVFSRSLLIVVIILLTTSLVIIYSGNILQLLKAVLLAAAFVIMPSFFNDKKLMLHDILSKTSVIIDNRNLFQKKEKRAIWIALILSLVANIFLSNQSVKTITRCVKFSNFTKYEEIISQCNKISEEFPSGKLNLIVGYANYKLQNYDTAIKKLNTAHILGDKDAPYFMVLSNIKINQLDKALATAKNYENNILMQFLISDAYLKKYQNFNRVEDLKNGLEYFNKSLEIKNQENLYKTIEGMEIISLEEIILIQNEFLKLQESLKN